MLIEALIGIVLFAIGVLGLVALQGSVAKGLAEAKYRAQAGFLANQIVAAMWLDNGNIGKYAHYASGQSCKPDGAPSPLLDMKGGPFVKWLAAVDDALPNAAIGQQRINVNGNQVQVTICWKPPQATDWSHFDLTAYISGA